MGLTNKEKKDDPPPEPVPVALSDGELQRHRWRYKEARRMDFNWCEAKLFASSEIDLEEMRALARSGCAPDLILKILL